MGMMKAGLDPLRFSMIGLAGLGQSYQHLYYYFSDYYKGDVNHSNALSGNLRFVDCLEEAYKLTRAIIIMSQIVVFSQ